MKTIINMAALFMACTVFSQAQSTLAERLGYPPDAKLLIIHADDLAVAHAENQASFIGMEQGMVNSASIMAPCPWLPEVADYAKSHPDHDMGLHLTLTSEWKHFKWGSVASSTEVSSLLDNNGYFYDNCNDLAARARLAEVEKELRAQIEKAKMMGINPTHLDSHMGCLFNANTGFLDLYLRLGREYGIPAMISADLLPSLPSGHREKIAAENIVVDRVLTALPEDFKNGMAKYYEKTLRNLQPGVNVLLIHTAYDNAEMQGVTVDHPDWGAAWRQMDFNFFTSKTCRKILKQENIRLVTWKEIGKLLK